MLDRASSIAIAMERERERERIRSEDVAHLEKVRLNQEIAADLLLTGNLEYFDAEEEAFTFRSGRKVTRFHPKGRLSLRVINIATGETRFARVVDLAAEPFQSTDHKWATPLADALAQEVARQLIDAIFPTRILHVDANTAYLNTGGDLFRVGELLDIYALEGQLIDPYTGERLGPIERRVEQIRITSVSDKQAVAEVLEGRGSIAPGSICRPIAASSPESEPTPKAPLIEKPSVDSTW